MNTIQEQWDLFNSLVIPVNAPPIQKQEMRRSFYAGAQAMAKIQLAITEKGVSQEQATEILSGCHDEITEFAELLKKGKA